MVAMMVMTSVMAADAASLKAVLPKDAKTVVVTNTDTAVTKTDGDSYLADVKSTYKAAQSLYQYEYNASNNTLTLISDNVVVNADGKAAVKLTDNFSILSDRAITENLTSPNAPKPQKPATSTSNTGDNTLRELAFAGGLIILSAGAIVVIRTW